MSLAKLGSCHKCAASLNRGLNRVKADPNDRGYKFCSQCTISYHTTDCGFRFLRAGLPATPEMLETCPKCSQLCFCCGGMVKCHAGSLRLKRRKPEPAHEEGSPSTRPADGSCSLKDEDSSSSDDATVAPPPDAAADTRSKSPGSSDSLEANLDAALTEVSMPNLQGLAVVPVGTLQQVLTLAVNLQTAVCDLQAQVVNMLSKNSVAANVLQGGNGLMGANSAQRMNWDNLGPNLQGEYLDSLKLELLSQCMADRSKGGNSAARGGGSEPSLGDGALSQVQVAQVGALDRLAPGRPMQAWEGPQNPSMTASPSDSDHPPAGPPDPSKDLQAATAAAGIDVTAAGTGDRGAYSSESGKLAGPPAPSQARPAAEPLPQLQVAALDQLGRPASFDFVDYEMLNLLLTSGSDDLGLIDTHKPQTRDMLAFPPASATMGVPALALKGAKGGSMEEVAAQMYSKGPAPAADPLQPPAAKRTKRAGRQRPVMEHALAYEPPLSECVIPFLGCSPSERDGAAQLMLAQCVGALVLEVAAAAARLVLYLGWGYPCGTSAADMFLPVLLWLLALAAAAGLALKTSRRTPVLAPPFCPAGTCCGCWSQLPATALQQGLAYLLLVSSAVCLLLSFVPPLDIANWVLTAILRRDPIKADLNISDGRLRACSESWRRCSNVLDWLSRTHLCVRLLVLAACAYSIYRYRSHCDKVEEKELQARKNLWSRPNPLTLQHQHLKLTAAPAPAAITPPVAERIPALLPMDCDVEKVAAELRTMESQEQRQQHMQQLLVLISQLQLEAENLSQEVARIKRIDAVVLRWPRGADVQSPATLQPLPEEHSRTSEEGQ